jgi:TP901 family phage tail tape measure protein
MAQTSVIGILRILLQANTAQFDTDMRKASDAVKRTAKDMRQVGQSLTDVGSTLTKAFTVPIAGIAAASAKLAIDFESSFAGVRKTLDATEPELQAIAAAFRELAKTIPINVNELNKLGEAAGALGIPKEDVVDFARVMALLGETTNLTSEQAAESIAKIQNSFGAAGKDTDRFAATLVALGNDGASTESQIVEMAARIAGAGNAIGITQGEVLAFASALSSVGIEAEMGGSAISRVFVDIASAVSQGGKDLEGFAKAAGMSVESFSTLFREDAAQAVNAFIVGLGNIKKSGGDLIGTLNEMGITEIRLRDTLLRTAGAGDLLTNALTLQKKAWAENTALTDEARKRFETTAARAELLWNKLKDVGITLGNALKPAIDATITAIDKLLPILDSGVKLFAMLPKEMQLAALGTAAIVAAMGPLLVIIGQVALGLSSLTAAFTANGVAMRAIGPASAIATTGIGAVRTAALALLTPLNGIVLAAGAAALALTHFIEKRAQAQLDAATTAAQEDTIRVAIERGANALINYTEAIQFNDEWNRKRLAGLKAAADETKRTTTATQSLSDKLDAQNAKLSAADKEIAQLSATTKAKLSEAIKSGAFSMKELSEATGLSELALQRFETSMKRAGKATKDSTRDFDESVRAHADYLKILDQVITAEARRAAAEGTARRIDPLKESAEDAANRIAMFKILQSGIPVIDGVITGIQGIGKYVDIVVPKIITLGDTLKANLRSVIEGIPEIFKNAFTGGGGLLGALKAIGVQIADALTKPLIAKLGGALANLILGGKGGTGGLAGSLLGGVAGPALGGLLGAGAGAGAASAAAAAAVANASAAVTGGVGLSAGTAAAGLGSTIAIGAATAGIGAAAVGVALLVRKLMSSAGRDAVEAFADSFGGFDALREKLGVLGEEGERLWVNLTQKVGRGNKEQAASAIAAIEEALAKHQEDAQRLTEEHAAAVAAVQEKYSDTLNAIDQERKTLMDRVAAEMPEEVMGIQETLDRARIDQLDKDKAAIEEKQRLELEALDEALARAEGNAQKFLDSIRDIFAEGVDLPIREKRIPDGTSSINPDDLFIDTVGDWERGHNFAPPPEFARGSGGFRDFGAGTLAMLHGVEAVVRPGDVQAATRPIILMVNDRELARAVVPVFPGEASRLGVRVRS